MKKKYKTGIGWILFGFGFLMLADSIRLCFSSDIWYDELFTMGMAGHSYGEFIRFTARDVHPPLYYGIVKFVTDLCRLIVPSADRVVLAKMVSVIPYFLLLIYVLAFLKKRFGMFISGLFFFCILAMPQMSAYTVEIRMYSWALFFVTAAYFHAYAIVCGHSTAPDSGEGKGAGQSRIHFAALTLYGLAAAYTQYFACVAVIMVYGYLFVWFLIQYHRQRKAQKNMQERRAGIPRELKNWFVCVAVSVIGYLPWLFVLFSQITTVRENYWILPLTWRSLGGCVKFLLKPAFTNEILNTVLAVVVFLIYIFLLAVYNHKKDHFYALAGCFVLCGLVAFGFVASFVVRPIFVYRYMLPSMGCFWFCFALCLDALTDGEKKKPETEDGRPAKAAAWRQILQAAVCLLIFAMGLRNYRAFMGEEEYKIVLMKETEQAVSDIIGSDMRAFDRSKSDKEEQELPEPDMENGGSAIILYNFDQLQAVMQYYVKQENYLWNGTPEPLVIDLFGVNGTVEETKQIKEWLAEGRKVWFFGSFNSREDIREEWEKDGIMTQEIKSCFLERYWFNIYSVTL